MFIEALFTITGKMEKTLIFHLVNVKQTGIIHTMEHHQKATTWMNLQDIMPRERSQPPEVKSCMTTFMWHLRKGNSTGMENRSLFARGRGGVRAWLQSGSMREYIGVRELLCVLIGDGYIKPYMCQTLRTCTSKKILILWYVNLEFFQTKIRFGYISK